MTWKSQKKTEQNINIKGWIVRQTGLLDVTGRELGFNVVSGPSGSEAQN